MDAVEEQPRAGAHSLLRDNILDAAGWRSLPPEQLSPSSVLLDQPRMADRADSHELSIQSPRIGSLERDDPK